MPQNTDLNLIEEIDIYIPLVNAHAMDMNQNIIKIIDSSSIPPRHFSFTAFLDLLPLKHFSFLGHYNTGIKKALCMIQSIEMKLISAIGAH